MKKILMFSSIVAVATPLATVISCGVEEAATISPVVVEMKSTKTKEVLKSIIQEQVESVAELNRELGLNISVAQKTIKKIFYDPKSLEVTIDTEVASITATTIYKIIPIDDASQE